MNDLVNDINQDIKSLHMVKLGKIFLEPSQSNLSTEQINDMSQLYDLAKLFDANDPVGWIEDFNRSQPLNIEIAEKKTRIGKVLALANIYKNTKFKEMERKQQSRDF